MKEKLEQAIEKLIDLTTSNQLKWVSIPKSRERFEIKTFRTAPGRRPWYFQLDKAVGVFLYVTDKDWNVLYEFPPDIDKLRDLYLVIAEQTFDIDKFINDILAE